MQIEDIKPSTVMTVSASVSGVEVTKALYSDRTFLPDRVYARFVYLPVRHQDGTVEHGWVCNSLGTSGQRVLKPGKDGNQRLGQERCKREWDSYGSDDVVDYYTYRQGNRTPLPDWAVQAIERLRPSGPVQPPYDV